MWTFLNRRGARIGKTVRIAGVRISISKLFRW